MRLIDHPLPERSAFHRRSHGRLGAYIALAAVLGGCTFPGSRPSVETTIVTPPSQVDLHPRVAELINDGDATAIDMARAYEAQIRCMESAGAIGRYAFSAETPGLGMVTDYYVPGDTPDGRDANAIADRCSEQFVAPVEQLFEDPVPFAEQQGLWRQRIIDCLSEVDPTYSTIPSDVPVDSGSLLYRRGYETHGTDSPIVECIDTGGIGWTEFGAR